jgi:tricorn protease
LIDYSYEGPGVKVGAVPPRSLGSYPKTALRPGEIVTAINGHAVSLNEELWKRLANQDGRDVTYTVAAVGGTPTREVKFRAMSAGEWNSLLSRNRIDARRKYVEEKSGGRLTYVMIPGMNQPALLRFKEEAWQYTRGKQGLIIDVRGNGGGNTADQIIELLERTPHAYYRQRDAEPVPAPGEMLRVQYVVMEAENSYSNAEMFPAAMKDAKLATLVGMPTPGYVIWTSGFTLVDGTSCRMPGSGSYRLDGTPLEDNGQKPDYEVDLTPEEFYAGKDPQLDKAIEVLMGKTK